ncbi:MAG: hypothetical protein J5640_05830 [Bacteroidales bacterium]|nr:hypothetical protein [Bacteroidales bacterium]
MKSTKHLLLALIIAASCTAIEEPGVPSAEPVGLVLTATRESMAPASKSILLDDGSVWWDKAEEISLFSGSGVAGGSKFVSQNSSMATTVDFSGSITISAGKNFWGVYPYSTFNESDGSSVTMIVPARQTASPGNFSGDAFPAIGTSKTMRMAFWNVCGGVCFFVTKADIKSFSIRGNNGEALAGQVKVKFGEWGVPEIESVLDPKTEVVLNAPDGGTFEPGRYYYLSLLPVELTGGITITLRTASKQGVIESSNPQTVKRSVFGTLKNINSRVAQWEDYVPDDPEAPAGLLINEVAAHGDSSGFDTWVEIINTSGETATLDGLSLFLTTSSVSGQKVGSLSGTLAAGERKVFSTASGGGLTSGIASNALFTLSLGTDSSNSADTFVRSSELGSLGPFASYQRIPDGGTEWRKLTYSSAGRANEVFDVSSTRPTAVWAWGSHLSDLVANNGAKMRDMKNKGYDHILMNSAGFTTSSYRTNAIKFIKLADEMGITVHAWIQCFYQSGSWISPIDDNTKTYKEDVYARIRQDAASFVENWGVKGIHLDYIRFPGTASKHNYTTAVNSVSAVNRCCREIRETCDGFGEGLVTSAALMPEPNSESSYGQNPAQMAQYIHILMPMIYRYGDYNFSDATFKSRSNYYASQAATSGGVSWSGIQTYDTNTKGLSAEALRSDINLIASTNAAGLVLFRYQLGTFPDINDLWQ